MKKILSYLREHLEITIQEARSTLAFLLAALASCAIYLTTSYMTESEYARYTLSLYPNAPPEAASAPKEKFKFDPNTATHTQLTDLGVPLRTARTVVNYRNKGGKFRYKEDLQKIYSLPAEVYAALEPWIALPVKPAPTQKKPGIKQEKHSRSPQKIQLDINLADTTDLIRLKGIGPTFAARILRFRDALGGFHSLDQLDETYGISPEALAALKKAAVIQTGVKAIPINHTEQFRHPYLKTYQVKAMLEYRKQHGPFRSIEDLKEIKVLHEETIQKIAPYLSF